MNGGFEQVFMGTCDGLKMEMELDDEYLEELFGDDFFFDDDNFDDDYYEDEEEEPGCFAMLMRMVRDMF